MNETLSFLVFASGPIFSAVLLIVFAKFFKPALASRAWLQLVIGNVLAFSFLGTLVFLGAESYYRFIYDTTDSFDYTKVSQRWQERYYHVNAQGVRDSVDYQGPIPPGKRRITFFGDSFTAGHGVKDVENRFANRLRQANPQWDVQVLAGLGQDTGDELDLLEQVVDQDFQLDQAVLVYCLNDISDIVPESQVVNDRIYEDSKKQNWLVRNSYFANLLYYRLKARHDPNISNYYGFVLAAYRGRIWKEQQARLTALRDRVASVGGHLLVVTFPFLHAPLDGTYKCRFVHQQLAEFWADLDVPHLDLLAVYEGIPPRKLVVNRMDAHPNEFAHRLAAEAIERFLDKHITPKPSNALPDGPSAKGRQILTTNELGTIQTTDVVSAASRQSRTASARSRG